MPFRKFAIPKSLVMNRSFKLNFLLAVILVSVASSCGTLEVMSFNVRQSHAKETDPFNSWNSRKEACLEMLRLREPDIVGLQEAQFKNQWSFFRDSLASVYGSVGVGRDDGAEKGETSGFLYRKSIFNLLDSGTFWQSDTPDTPSVCFDDMYKCPRSATWGLLEVKATGKKFIYINTHTSVNYYAQKMGLKIIFDWLDGYNTQGLPYILSGDLNMSPDNELLGIVRKRMMDSREAAPSRRTDHLNTYNAWGRTGKAAILDYIWISDGISCSGYFTDTVPYGGHELISDHYPIISKLKFRK